MVQRGNATEPRAAAASGASHAVRAGPIGTVRARTKIVKGWPNFWANFRARIGIFSQSVGPSLAIWVNPVQNSFGALAQRPGRAHGVDVGDAAGAHLVGGEVE